MAFSHTDEDYMKTEISFNCLCCNRKVVVESLQAVTASEHICPACKNLNEKEYALVLAYQQNRSIHA
jgi:hypothetical protein